MADDRALVRRCLKGEAEAIRLLVEQYQSDVFSLCLRMLGHRHDAEDAAQEVFLRVFRSLRRWDAQRPLKPWIIAIAVNRCRTWMAQRARRPELADYLHESVEDRGADDSRELVQEIAAALAEMRPDYRAVFVMFHELDQPYEEIAEALDRPVGTIKTWLHRARTEVLQRLRNRGMVAGDAEMEAEKKQDEVRGKR